MPPAYLPDLIAAYGLDGPAEDVQALCAYGLDGPAEDVQALCASG